MVTSNIICMDIQLALLFLNPPTYDKVMVQTCIIQMDALWHCGNHVELTPSGLEKIYIYS